MAFKVGKNEAGQTCIYAEQSSGSTVCINVNDEAAQEKLAQIFGEDICIHMGDDGQVELSCEPAKLYGILECRVQVAYDPEFNRLLHDSGFSSETVRAVYEAGLALAPCTRYYGQRMAE